MNDCVDFVAALFGERWPAPMRALLWRKEPVKHSTWIRSAVDAAPMLGEHELYVGAGLVGVELDAGHRGKAIDIRAIPGTWLDVDINGGPEKRARYAPDEDAALDLIRSLGPPPTLIVNSGYGLHAWWLFHEMWSWKQGDQAEWERAKSLVHGFWLRAQAIAHERGFMIDPAWDLARVMRLPGTMNTKDKKHPVPVVWIDQDDSGPRYEIDALSEVAAKPRAVHRGASVHVQVAPGSQLASDAREDLKARTSVLIENDDRFAELWKRSNDQLVNDTSASGWCMALTHRVAAAGWTDQQIADLLVNYREFHRDSDKSAIWYEKTIQKARDSSLRERAKEVEAEIASEALDTLTDLAYQPIVDPNEALAAFNSLAPGLQAKELIQQGVDPSVARYWLVLSNEERIEIGSARDLRNPDRVTEAIMVVTGFTMMPVKREKWLVAVRGLVKARRHIDSETLADIARGWMVSYLDSNLADEDEWNEAAYSKKPYLRDGFVWITLDDFHRYVRRNLGERVEKSDIQARLGDLGFARCAVSCNSPVGRDGRTSRAYWKTARERVIPREGSS